MKFAHIFLIIFAIVLYYHATSAAVSTTKFSRYSPQVVRMSKKNVNFNRVAGIVCFYAKNGRWPSYPKNWRPFVTNVARRIFAMSDANIKRYCRQVLQLNFFNWSFQPTLPRPSVRSTTASYYPTSTLISSSSTAMITQPTATTLPTTTIFTTRIPSTTVSTTTLNIPSSTTINVSSSSTTTVMPSSSSSTTTAFPTLSSSTTSILPSSTSTVSPTSRVFVLSPTLATTTKAPAASASASGSYSGSYSGSSSGSGSAYTASLTGQSLVSDKLIQFPNDSGLRSFRKARNGDIVVKWFPGHIKLRKIDF